MRRLWAALDPQAHPGWSAFRVAWALVAMLTWLGRGYHFPENYSAAGVLFERSALPLTRWIVLTEPTAWAVWGTLLAALALLVTGRVNRPAILVATLAMWTLNFHEGLNFKAYDRLLFWQGVVLLFAPGGGDGRRVGNPGARYALMLVYLGLYGSTGWMKLLNESTWSSGEVLRYALEDNNFGLRPLGVLLAQYPSAVAPAGWLTVAFETSFPFLVWWRRPRPWLLAGGVLMHLGILATMHVNTFSLIAISGYPVLLDAEQWRRASAWLWGDAPDRTYGKALRGAIVATASAYALGWAVPQAAYFVWGPATGADWRPPAKDVRAAVRADVATLAAAPRDTDEAIAAAEGYVRGRLEGAGWTVTASDGELRATRGGAADLLLCAHVDTREGVPGADDNASGVAALLGVADLLGRTDAGAVALTFYRGAACRSGGERVVVVDQVGRFGVGAGTQTWPSLWGWVMPWQGDFLGVAGPSVEAGWVVERLRAGAPLPVVRLPGGLVREYRSHKADMARGAPDVEPEGTRVLVTDTGRLRDPAVNSPKDLPERLDEDALTYVVEALASMAQAPR